MWAGSLWLRNEAIARPEEVYLVEMVRGVGNNLSGGFRIGHWGCRPQPDFMGSIFFLFLRYQELLAIGGPIVHIHLLVAGRCQRLLVAAFG